MGNWCGCSYKSGWSKSNACPPGFSVQESCGCFSDTISCRLTATPSSAAVPVSARYIEFGACTSDPSKTTPPAAPSCGSGKLDLGSRVGECCSNAFGACDVSGYKEIRACADNYGDKIFDTWSPHGCIDKAEMGLSNNFQAQAWCKSSGMNAGSCWIPYSMNADNQCFPLNKDTSGQWKQLTSDGYGGKSGFGGAQVLLPGSTQNIEEFVNAGATNSASSSIKAGPIGGLGVGAVGAAAVVGFFMKKGNKKKAPKAGVELNGNAV